MANDDHFYAPGHVGQPCALRSKEHLWRLRKDHRTADAELRFHSEHGVEIQFLYSGEMAYGRRWPTRALAVAEADDKRQEFERAA
jgi:hypothetical protein